MNSTFRKLLALLLCTALCLGLELIDFDNWKDVFLKGQNEGSAFVASYSPKTGGVRASFLNDCSSSYKSGPYYENLKNLSLTGIGPVDLVRVAESQIGYHEGDSWDQISGTSSGTSDYTEYNRWYPVGAQWWCNLFVGWCFDAAGLGDDIAYKNPFYLAKWRDRGAGIYSWGDYKNGFIVPSRGDIIIYGTSTADIAGKDLYEDSTRHIGIISSYENGTFYNIEGNYSDGVTLVDHTPDYYTGWSGTGFVYAIVRPNYGLASDYFNKCEPEIFEANLRSTNSFWLKSLPCSEKTTPDSINVVTHSLPAGTEMQARARWLNSEGNVWYEVTLTSGSDSGAKGYVLSDLITVVNHTHNRNEFYMQASEHPHVNIYKCTICGKEIADFDSVNYDSDCPQCKPGKPSFVSLGGFYNTGTPVSFYWNPTANTTHYNIWLYKKNTGGTYEGVKQYQQVQSGFQLSLDPGEYKVELQSYDSTHTVNNDWAYTESDPAYFRVADSGYIEPETPSDILPDEISLTQQTGETCTLASAAMMLRARMYRSENSNWASITEEGLRPKAWTTEGLYHNFSYSIDDNTMTVAHTSCSGLTISELKSLLDSHPEGIVLYERAVPHAIFVSDYVGDTFYGYDPARSGYYGRRTLDSTYLAQCVGNQASILSGADDYWYVSSYTVNATSPAELTSGAGQTIEDGSYIIVAAACPDYYMDIDGSDYPAAPGSNISLWGTRVEDLPLADTWTVKYVDDGGFYSICQNGTNIALEIQGTSKTSAANIQVGAYNGSDTQKWSIVENDDGSYSLQSKYSGMCADISGKLNTTSNIQQWEANFGAYQQWNFIPCGEHTHDKGTFMYYWEEHPHYSCYKCSVCGEIWEDRDSPNYLTTCDLCKPGIPAFIDMSETYDAGAPVVFAWNSTEHTTHYNFWLYKEAAAGEYLIIEHKMGNVDTVESPFTRYLEPGRYKAELQAYDSNHWFSDQHDWMYSESEPIYFTVGIYTVTYSPNGGTGAPEPQKKTQDETLKLSTLVPTRTGYTFLGWSESADSTVATYQPGGEFVKNADTTLYAVWQKKAPDFVLPAALTTIGEEAFACGAFSYAHLPDGVTRIEKRAFADCPNLRDVDIPESATSIDPTAFAGVTDLTIHGADGSYAEFFAGKYGFAFVPNA